MCVVCSKGLIRGDRVKSADGLRACACIPHPFGVGDVAFPKINSELARLTTDCHQGNCNLNMAGDGGHPIPDCLQEGAYAGLIQIEMGWGDKTVEPNLLIIAHALILLKAMSVRQKTNSVSRKQGAASENQCNMYNRIPNPQIPAQVDAPWGELQLHGFRWQRQFAMGLGGARGQRKQSNDPGNNQHILNTPTIGRRWRANGTPCHIQHSPNTPTTGLCECGNDTSKSTGRSG